MSKSRGDRYKEQRRRKPPCEPERQLGACHLDQLTQMQWSLYLLLCDIDPNAEFEITDWSEEGLLTTIERVIYATAGA